LFGCAGRLVEDASNLELLVREDVALQQLVLAALGSNSLVVEQAVKVMAAAGSYAGAARRLVRHNVVQAITDLVASRDMVRWWRRRERVVACCAESARRAEVFDRSSQ
jgi:RNA-splicing ligase RtcB